MKLIIALTLVVIVIIALIVASSQKYLARNQLPASINPATISREQAIINAYQLYSKKKSEGVDFSSGPCLGTIASDWVLDIAHNPRQPIDDLPENQCADYLNGRAHHFVELDPNGQLIRAL